MITSMAAIIVITADHHKVAAAHMGEVLADRTEEAMAGHMEGAPVDHPAPAMVARTTATAPM